MLKIEGLKVALDADAGLVKAIDGLSLSIRRGETFALVGESGCGKSMTALALMRLLPENGRVTHGNIVVEGEDVLALPESSMRAVRGGKIGMIFQEPSTSLNPVMRVGDQIIEAIETHTPLRGAPARAQAIEWLRRVGIPEPERRIDDYPFRMSGGQKQRVMIAMTLAGEPDFLIADEPTTALDVTIQAQILDLLKDLQKQQGMGLLLITHDLAVVSGMAHRVALMYAGQIIEVASADEFFRSPKHPYARLLLKALPDTGKRGGSLAAIAGTVPALSQEFTACRFAPRCDRAFDACHNTVPELIDIGQRSVRCLLYRYGQDPLHSTLPDAAPLRFDAPRTPAGAGEPLLDVRALSVRFPIRKGLLQRSHGAFTAVNGVSFSIRPGQTLALVGESGCGKTTTGKAIVQLLRHQAVIDGQAQFNGQDLFRLEGDALRDARRSIQIIFQDPFASLNPRMRVFDILEEGLLALRPDLDAAARRANLERLVDQVGLRREALGRYPHEFSGGQRQRIAIARALAVEPKLIVCDEPTSALDVSVQAQILNLLRQLQRDLGVSYLFITHNIGVVEYVADHIAVMQRGLIEEAGPAQAVLSHPTSEYTRTLLAAVPRIEAAVHA
jgi:peptide/nickel transport system ATP-binding protein